MQKIIDFFISFYHSGFFTALVIIVIAGCAVYLLKLIYNRICHSILPRLKYERYFSDKGVYQGETTSLVEVIYNPTPFPLFFADVEGYIYNDLRVEEFEFNSKKGMQFFKSRFTLLLPYMRIRRTHSVKCLKRGYYRLETIQLFLARSDRYIDAVAEIFVYPELLEAPMCSSPVSLQQGDVESRRWLMRDPFSISGIRDYTFGDTFSQINFKATAKAGGLMNAKIKVNDRDFCSNRNFILLVNYSVDPENPIPTKIYDAMQEEALGRSVGLIQLALENGFRVGFGANCLTINSESSVSFNCGSGDLHFSSILCAMSEIRNSPGISFPAMLDKFVYDGITDTEFFIFSPYSDPDIEARIRNLEYHGNGVSLIIGDRGDEDEK